jgi:predicted RNA polymerase sigma factor
LATDAAAEVAAHRAIERAYREEWTSLLATLVGQVGGDVGLAEEAVADAFAAAAAVWPDAGVPARLGGWLTTVARRRAIDALRRDRTRAANQAALEHLERLVRDDNDTPPGDDGDHGYDSSAVADDRLRLLFTCCHPALALDWPQIAALYGELERIAPSPVATVNRAAALAFADGPHVGLALLATLEGDDRLDRYQPLHAARAELLARAGDHVRAAAAYRRAIELSQNPAERRALEARASRVPKQAG